MSNIEKHLIETDAQQQALVDLFPKKYTALSLPIINFLASRGVSVITSQYINDFIALLNTAREAALLEKTKENKLKYSFFTYAALAQELDKEIHEITEEMIDDWCRKSDEAHDKKVKKAMANNPDAKLHEVDPDAWERKMATYVNSL